MKFTAERSVVLKPLQAVVGVVERRQTMPILSHVLMRVAKGRLSLTATDLEVELRAEVDVESTGDGEVTVPGRKLHDICRALPSGAKLEFGLSGEKLTIKAGRSRFSLSTLRAADFPVVDEIAERQSLKIEAQKLRRLIEKTHFCMAQQDVRYYLNGLLLETDGPILRAVATDGHRLAIAELELDKPATQKGQIIVPRKGILELQRLLDGSETLELTIGGNHLRVVLDDTWLTTKLIDGRFPDYGRVIPTELTNVLRSDRELLRGALQRTAILSNEKYRGVRLVLSDNALILQANNPEQEEAEENVEVEYGGDDIEIGFNVNYLLDALGAVDGETVEMGVKDANSSCLIRDPGAADMRFVVMPMRL